MSAQVAQPRKRSGLSAERSYRIQSQALSQLQDLYSMAIAFHLTHEDISDKTLLILNSPPVMKAPYHVRSYLHGWLQARRDDLYARHLMWVLSVDNILLTSKEVDRLTTTELDDLYGALVEKCEQSVIEYQKHGGSCRQPPTREEFDRNVSRFLSSEYKSPWSRINSELSRHVWIDSKTGAPLYDKPFDRKFLPQVKEGQPTT